MTLLSKKKGRKIQICLKLYNKNEYEESEAETYPKLIISTSIEISNKKNNDKNNKIRNNTALYQGDTENKGKNATKNLDFSKAQSTISTVTFPSPTTTNRRTSSG